jgi:hypothetical protein
MMLLDAEEARRRMVAVGERVFYLSLALDARRALKAIRVASSGDTDLAELRDAIRAATESLEALLTHPDLYSNHSPGKDYGFEEIQTLREVFFTSFDPKALVRSLKSLISEESGRPAQEDFDSARKFFRALESRALHHYNDPALGNALMA